MKAVYASLVNNIHTYGDLKAVGENAGDLKFTLVNRVTRKALDLDMTVVGNDRRHEGVEVSTVTLSRDSDSATGFLADWWNGTEVYGITLEWYHIDTAEVMVTAKGNPKHLANLALRIEKA